MYDKRSGYINEYDFVCLLNEKKVGELDINSREMIDKIFNNTSNEDIIKCWKNHFNQKGDIMIKIKSAVKSVSIKMGAKNSLHTEHIHYFIKFLKDCNMPMYIIKSYIEYHYADGTLSGKGIERLSVEEYKKKNQKKIDLINFYFSDYNFVLKCIDRFILKGNNCDYKISGIIYGVPYDYFFLSSSEIITILLKQKDEYSTGVHVSKMAIQPKARDLSFSGRYEKERHQVQVKWFNIFDDLIKEVFKKL